MSGHRLQIKWNSLARCGLLSVMLAAPACRREQAAPTLPGPPAATGPSADVSASQPTGGPGAGATGFIGVDAKDDPDAPRALPKSDEPSGWVKTRPVEIADAGKLADFVEPGPLLDVLRTFPLRRLARCTYEMPGLRSDVLFVEPATSDDAFGLLSVLDAAPGQSMHVDGSLRAVRTAGDVRTAGGWQGRAYLRIRFAGVDDENEARKCDQLFDRIIFNLPSADPPLLMRAIPSERLAGSRVWFVRSTAALAVVEENVLRGLHAAGMDARLGLDGRASLSVAAVQVADDEPYNLVWLVQYPDSASAAAAYHRYQQALQLPKTELDRNSIPYEPKGTFLAGSWTAGQESIQGLVPRLKEALPQ